MHKVKIIPWVILVLMQTQFAIGQTAEIDSLKKLLATSKTDTTQISLMNQIAELSEDSDLLTYPTNALHRLNVLSPSLQKENKKFFFHQLAASYYWISTYYNIYTQESDSGIKYLHLSLNAARQIDDLEFTGMVYNDFAVVYNYKGVDTSLYWLNKSLPYTIASKDSSLLGTAYSNFGHLYRTKGEFQKALDYLYMGMAIDQKLGNTEDVAVELNNIGKIYFDMDFYNEAIGYFRRSLVTLRQADDKRGMSIRYNNIASVYEKRKQYDTALAYYDSSLNLKLKIGSKGSIAEAYSNIGHTWMTLGDYDKAMSLFHQSLTYAKQGSDSFQLFTTYTNLADVFLRKGVKTDSAEKLLKGAYDYFKINGSLLDIQEITHLLMDVYGQKKDFEKAYSYTLEYLTARDSVESKDARKNALRKQFEYEYQNKSAIAAATQKEKDAVAAVKLREQTNFRNVAIAGSVFLLIIVALLFNRYRLKQKTTKALEAKNEIIEKEKQRAEESEKFKSRFLANMSHEIRTPMNAVIGLTNLLLDSSATEKQTFYLSAIKKSSENLMVILNDVLDLSKLEAGKMELEKIPLRIREVAENVIITLRHKADEKGLKLETEIANDVPEFVTGDPARLYQVLINLVGNAIKFTERGSVKLSVRCHAELVEALDEPLQPFDRLRVTALRFEVTDTGIGIAKEKLETIFESFKQAADDTSRKFGGTGLGLSISQQIIQLYGSEIQVTSEENKGSVFSFTIQCEISSAEEFQKYHQPAAEIDYSRFASLKILLAEDNEYNQLVTVESLKRVVPTLRIDVTENGREAVEALSEEDYDLILMDVQMPEMNGYEATKKIRNEFTGRKKVIPIIALTASATREEIQLGFEAGISAHLSKPFVAGDLLHAIARALGWSSTHVNSKAFFAGTPPGGDEAIDFSALEKFSEGDHKLKKLYIEKFIESAPETFSQVKKAFEKNELDDLKRIIHSIKPQLVLLGLQKLHHLAIEIEESIAAMSPPEKISSHLSQFESELGKAITLLSTTSLS